MPSITTPKEHQMSLSSAEVARAFAPIATDPERLALKNEISAAALEFAELLRRRVPYSRELRTALEAVEAAVDAAHNGVDRRYIPVNERRPAPATTGCPAAQPPTTRPEQPPVLTHQAPDGRRP